MKVLFLCTGNSCRSQMAEGFMRRAVGDSVEIFSAGLQPEPIHPLAIRTMEEVGIDISTHTSDHVDDVVGTGYFNYIITVCDHADKNCPSAVIALGKSKLHWPFDDPASATGTDEEIMATFRRVRDEIDQKVSQWVVSLKRKRLLT